MSRFLDVLQIMTHLETKRAKSKSKCWIMDKALAFFVMDDDNVHMIDDSYLLKVAKKPEAYFLSSSSTCSC